jgi:hypothetical protein
MKAALFTAIAVAAACGSAFAEDPAGKRTPNGGIEFYSNSHAGMGTVENGCILPWSMAGHPVTGYNPKRVDIGDATEFVDCSIPAVVKVVQSKPHTPHTRSYPPEPTPTPAPMPAPTPAKPVRE